MEIKGPPKWSLVVCKVQEPLYPTYDLLQGLLYKLFEFLSFLLRNVTIIPVIPHDLLTVVRDMRCHGRSPC